MKDTVTATEAKFRFGELLAKVSFGKKHITIKKQAKPLAVMIPIEDYQHYLDLEENRGSLTRRELLQKTIRLRESLPEPPPGSPDAVQIIREIRQSAR